MSSSSKVTVLITHTDPLISAGLVSTLSGRAEFEVRLLDAESPAVRSVPGRSAVAVADYDSGLRLIRSGELGRHRVLILTHRDSEAGICYALEHGAGGYLLQGCSVADIVSGIRLVCEGGVALSPLVATRVAERMKQQSHLTCREVDVLRQMMIGLSNKRMATQLELAVGTVKTHVKAVLRKLGASNRTHAVAVAQRRGILPEGDMRAQPPPTLHAAAPTGPEPRRARQAGWQHRGHPDHDSPSLRSARVHDVRCLARHLER